MEVGGPTSEDYEERISSGTIQTSIFDYHLEDVRMFTSRWASRRPPGSQPDVYRALQETVVVPSVPL